MSELTITIYAMTAFTFMFLAAALFEEYRMTHPAHAVRPVRTHTKNTRTLAGSRR